MLCNADLFPSPTYLSTLQAFFNRRPRTGAASGKLIRYDLERDEVTDVVDSAGLILTRQRRLKARGEGEVDSGQFDTELEVFGLDGAAVVRAGPRSTTSWSTASIWTRTSSRTRKTTIFPGAFDSPAGSVGTCRRQWPTTRARREALDRRHT